MSRSSKFIVFVAILASLLEIIDTSIVNVAIPTMMGNLGATLEDISWVITGYIIANAIVLPLSGWLGMNFGRKNYYVTCILLFTLSSVACGFAPNLLALTIFRVFQGLAGGALLPTSQALIQEQFPGPRAGIGSAIFGMSIMIGPTLGPTLGGYLTDNFGWRSIFNINLPLGLLAALLAYQYVEDSEPAKKPLLGEAPIKKPAMDVWGLVLLALGIGSLQFVLERGQADDWFSSGAIIAATLVAAFSLPGFVWRELSIPNPIVDLRLFKESVVRSGTLLMMSLGLFLYGVIFVLPIFVGRVLNFDATQTGMLFIPGALLTAAFMPFIGANMRRINPKIFIFIGFAICEVFIFSLTRVSSQTGQSQLFWSLLIRGAGMAFLFVPINTVVLSQFKGRDLGQVAGLMNLSRQIGGSIGIALIATLLEKFNAQNEIDVLQHVSLLNYNTFNTVKQMQTAMMGKMSNSLGLAAINEATLQSLKFRVANQVFIMSMTQLMWLLFFVTLLAMIPLYLMKVNRPITGPIDAH